jgi:large subunit ribosomal protein L29
MDIDKVRGLSDGELETELTNARRQLHDLRFQLATRQLTDHRQIARTRQTVARILTVLRERRMAEQEETAGGAGAGRGTAPVGAR